MRIHEASRCNDFGAAKLPESQQIVIPGDNEAGRGRLGALQDAVVIRVVAKLYSNGGGHNKTLLPQRREESIELGFGPFKLSGQHLSYLVHNRL